MQITFKNTNEEISKYSIKALLMEKCLKSSTSKNSFLALTPKYLDMVHNDQELMDIYGNIKTKGEFLEDRKGVLYVSATGGATAFGIILG